MSDATPDERRARLFLRGPVSAGVRETQSSLADRLEQLAESSALAVQTHTWPKRVPAEEAEGTDRYERFTAWADEHGAELTPFFEERNCYSWQTGERYRALVLPLAALAVHEEGELAAVYPHADEHGVYTVDDAITDLERELRHPGEARPAAADD